MHALTVTPLTTRPREDGAFGGRRRGGGSQSVGVCGKGSVGCLGLFDWHLDCGLVMLQGRDVFISECTPRSRGAGRGGQALMSIHARVREFQRNSVPVNGRDKTSDGTFADKTTTAAAAALLDQSSNIFPCTNIASRLGASSARGGGDRGDTMGGVGG